jgi:TolB-like protein/class 3 adenylate cyclase/Flp pilus assembly protein TadD
MTQEGFKRKLTAILSADVIGYSRLMRDDEEATVRDLAAHRVLITEIIQQHNGRVVDSPGDNLLAEFASVVDAVNGAVKIQDEIKKSNTGIPEDRRMEFRIGINLGDVIEEEERIYGDGVNIAARVEGLAAGGGIAISGTVYEHIKEKLSLGYHYLGEQDVKNISEPVRVYRLLTEPADAGKMIGDKKPKSKKLVWATSGVIALIALAVGAFAIWNYYFRPSFEPASVEKMAFPLPDKPGDTDQDYIADGFTENIITGLSQVPEMFVIARNSVFTYKGKPVKVKQVSEELGVRYVLEGSIQKAGDKLRVNAQLIDALKGHHLWAERYDRELKDLFDLQDEITLKILTALQVELVYSGEDAWKVWNRTNSFEAWSHFVKGLSHFDRITKQDNRKAQEYFEQATKLDPDYALAWIMLAYSLNLEGSMGWSESPADSTRRSFEIVQKASKSWEYNAFLHSLKSRRYMYQGEWEKSIVEGKKAIELVPNSSRFHILLAGSLVNAGRPEEAIVHAKKAIRLEPFHPAWFLFSLASSYAMLERYEEAIAVRKQVLERALKGETPQLWSHELLAAYYAGLDQMAEARAHVAEILKIDPNYNAETFRKGLRAYKDRAYVDRLVNLIRKAGLPEHPPLKLPDKPSIAVLPLKNLSGDPEQEYLSDGFTEDIITTLAKIPRMFVIARESSFTYKGKSVKIQEVGRDLGVRYVLEGSIQKSGDRIRITAQLIDAANGHHLWVEKYDRDLKNLFALKDEITMEIALALQVKLTEGEWARTWGAQTDNFETYIKVKQSLEHFRRFTPDDNILSRQKAKEALDLDPNYSTAMEMLAWTLLMDGLFGTSKTPEKSIEQAFELAQKVLDKGDKDSEARYLLGYAYLQRGQFEKAISELEIARGLFPNSAEINAGLGMVLSDAGRPMEAIPVFKKAIRMNPIPPSWYFSNLGSAYRDTEQYEKAALVYKKAIQQQPDNMFAHLSLAVCYVRLNRQEDAHAEVAEVLRINPKFSVERFAKNLRFKDQAAKQRHIDGMRKAGLPE